MARRPADYTAQMQATEERRRQQQEKQRREQQREQRLRQRQATNYGLVVLDILGARTTIDALAGLLLDSRDRAKTHPRLETEWAARGADYFRPAGDEHKRSTRPNGATGNGDSTPPAPAPEPARPRSAAPPGSADLLGGLATDRPGQGAAGEGRDHGERP